MSEFNLSNEIINYEKIVELVNKGSLLNHQIKANFIVDGDVKEFIRLLKNKFENWGKIDDSLSGENIFEVIDKLAGEKLSQKTGGSNAK